MGWESAAQSGKRRGRCWAPWPRRCSRSSSSFRSALLVAVQLASASSRRGSSPSCSRTRAPSSALTVFVFTFTFSLAVLVRIDTSVPLLTARLAAYGCLASLGVFLYLIDHVGKALRPSGALRAVALLGREVIENVYPRRLAEAREAPQEPASILSGEPTVHGDEPQGRRGPGVRHPGTGVPGPACRLRHRNGAAGRRFRRHRRPFVPGLSGRSNA